MAVAAWIVGGAVAVIWFGTWALRTAIWLAVMALRIVGWVALALFGLMSLAAMALLDRKQLKRIWRNGRAHAETTALLARERWS